MTVTIYTLWASMKGEEPSPWMIAAEDEFSWEANGERCDAVFKAARDLAERNAWEVREVEIRVDIEAICERFENGVAKAEIRPADDDDQIGTVEERHA